MITPRYRPTIGQDDSPLLIIIKNSVPKRKMYFSMLDFNLHLHRCCETRGRRILVTSKWITIQHCIRSVLVLVLPQTRPGGPCHVGQQWHAVRGFIKTYLGPAHGDLERCFIQQRIMRVRRARDGPRHAKVPCIYEKYLYNCTVIYLVRPETRAGG